MSKLKSGVSIYLKFGEKLKIPVNPEELEIRYPSDHKEYDVLGIGQIVMPGKPGLREISWESFFPASFSDPYVDRGAERPETYVKRIKEAMETKEAGRLIISRSGLYDTNIRCIISEFRTKDKGGEPGDMYYSITLKEYRDYSPKVINIITEPTADGTQAEASAETERAVETPVMRVGAAVIANGKYWYSSTGAKPFGTANNLNTTVTRIVSGAAYPICIGSYGWIQEGQLQIVG
ncbi:hypothetical protein AALB16_13835 [Lachnospiraceae bacterium 62-35]